MSTNANQKEPVNVFVESEPIEFPSQKESFMIPSLQLASIFTKYLKEFLVDFEGCFIDTNNGMVLLSIFLSDKTKAKDSNKLKSIERIAEPVNVREMDQAKRISMMNNRSRNKIYDLTAESKELFGSLSYNNKWDNRMASEIVDPGNRNIAYVKIIGIDPVKLLSKIYGSNVDGEKYQYRVSHVKTLGPDNYLLDIERLVVSNVADLAETIGFGYATVNGIKMVR